MAFKKIGQKCPKCDGAGKILTVSCEDLRLARESSGISLRELAKRLGFTPPYLSDIERGKRNCTKQIEAAYAKL